MINKRICFIACIKNKEREYLLGENIAQLKIPDGIQVETCFVSEVTSKAEGYNAAMRTSEAEIKVYISENIVIANVNIIYELISIFETDKDIGMVGIVGTRRISTDGIIRHVIMNNIGVVGKIYEIEKDLTSAREIKFEEINDDYEIVDAIEDCFIATNRDIDWREDLFNGFSYVGVAQCLEFRKHALRIVVARQKEPWLVCINDTQNVIDMENVQQAKRIFMEEYKGYYPSVSIMIPTYNRPGYIQKAIESVLNQTYKNIELVICDNSEDTRTQTLIKDKYSAYCDNIRYYHNEKNLGLLGNCQRANKEATHDIRCILCDDDYLSLDAIERQMNYFWLDNSNTINITAFDGGVYKIFSQDTIIDGEVAIEIMAMYNMTLFSFVGLFKASTIKEPFGTLNGRSPACNMDRYVGYLALMTGKGAYIHDRFYHSIEHGEHESAKPLVIIDGGNDYAHEVISMREYGFLRNNDNFNKAIETAEWYYKTFAMGQKIPNNLEVGEINALKDTVMYMEKIYNQKIELYKQQIANKHNIHI